MEKLSIKTATNAVRILKALSNQKRLQICNALLQQPLNVTQVADFLKIDIRLASNYLVRMWRDGYLGVKQQNGEMYYHLKENKFKEIFLNITSLKYVD